MVRRTGIGAIVAIVVMSGGCSLGLGAESEAGGGPAARRPAEVRQYVQTETGRWLVHDMNRPVPPVVDPGPDQAMVKAPSDAIVLFDGTEAAMANWTDPRGNPSRWRLGEGFMESVKGAGAIQTKAQFGSCQLHVEFATPSRVQGSSQGRGNSGVFLQGMYEVQVLDSYENRTYADGQCGALYGRAVPLVNACRPPGQWQAFDIVYHRPTFGPDGRVVRKATFTVLHNGVLIQDHVELEGGTGWRGPYAVTEYVAHGDRGPIQLQDHSNPVRFRNVWIRELKD